MVRVSKRTMASLTVLASLAVIGIYMLRERAAAPAAATAARFDQIDRVGAVYLVRWGGVPVGVSQLLYGREGDTLRITETLDVRMPAPGGQVQKMEQRAEQLLDRSLTLQRFMFTVRGGGQHGDLSQTTVVEGYRQSPDSLRFAILTGGGRTERTVAVPKDVVFGAGAWLRLMLSGSLQEGARYELLEIDPVSLSTRPTRFTIGAPRVVSAQDLALADEDTAALSASLSLHVYPLSQESAGLASRLELIETGIPLRGDLPLGLTLERASAADLLALRTAWDQGEFASPILAGADEATLIGQTAIAAGARIDHARELKNLAIVVSGVELPNEADGDAQTVRGDTVWVRVLPFPGPGASGYRLNPVGSRSPLTDDERLASFLAPEPFIESDRPEILAATRAATQGERDPAEAARRVADYVHRYLDKSYTASLPSAVEVLRGGQGDCNEHTVLLTAMLRAAGIPARPVSGLAYVDGAFYYHAWVEAWLGNMWIPLDATFGLAPADAARIRLFTGMSRMGSVVSMVGRLRLEIVNAV